MKLSESEVAQLILIEASKHGVKLWRNNNGAFQDKTGRWVYYGLGNDNTKASKEMASSDYIGCHTITVTPDMVGQKLAVMFTLETKESEWKFTGTERELRQQKWIDNILKRGGRGGFANSVDSFLKLIGL